MNILIISFHTCPVNKLGEKDTGGLNLYVHQLSEQLGEKEIITIDDIKYEKVQFVSSYDFLDWSDLFIGIWFFHICGTIGGHSDVCVPLFQANTAVMYAEEGDDIKLNLTVLREMN